ncbi:TonB-dependent siderophore receptor [Gluconacetobacter sp. Hr-1-5]|uniref:TonB-dependent siderophore receptor n=1 Tax=Gluconacetobacter sp. Hr-1-5 TaxID=3395370 RepID=UPI003B523B02
MAALAALHPLATEVTPAGAATTQEREDPTLSLRNFDIPAQPLSAALMRFVQQAGLQVTADSALLRGVNTSGVHGRLTPRQALGQLLAGTGLAALPAGGRTVVLTKMSSTITLGPVRVGGQTHPASDPQAPYGPGQGFVATRTNTATKTDTPIIKVPQSIYVVTRQQMDDLQPLTIIEALRYTPGISAPNPPGGGLPWVNSHDIYQRGFQSDTFMDGLIADTSPSTVEPFFMDRIEALSGPPSVMYGQALPGGAINVSLKRPTEKVRHEFNVGFGSYGRYEGQLDMSGPLTKDRTLLYRVVAIGDTQGDQTAYSHYKRLAIMPELTWNIDDDTYLTLIGQYNAIPELSANSAGPAMSAIFPGSYPRYSPHTFTGDPAFSNSHGESHLFEYIFYHRFNKFIQFYQNFRYEHNNGWFSDLFSLGLDPKTSELSRYAMMLGDDEHAVLMDSHAQMDFSTGPMQHKVLVGVDFRVQQESDIWGMDFNAPSLNLLKPQYYIYSTKTFLSNIGNSFSGDVSDYEQEGIYFQDQFAWKGLNVTLGGREDWNNYGGTFARAFTWRGGVNYVFDFGLAPYFSYATSFNPQVGNIYSGAQPQPLSGKQWEVGLKYQPPHSRMFFSAAAYDLRENNVLVTDPYHQNFSLQVGQVRVRGVELAANANLAQGLDLSASYTYMDPENSRTNLTDTDINGNIVSLKGKSPTQIPRNTVSLMVDYRLPREIAPGFSINAGLRYVGFTVGDQANSFHVPAYTLFDGGATYDFGALRPVLKGLNVRLSLVNAFNKEYVVNCTSSDSCAWGQLRRVTGQIGYRW